ncbi:MAG: leucine-rich repeat protein, partial [Clostridia bacterium]|nr:leucine-rich repeat protein [Clostridia bacterium]
MTNKKSTKRALLSAIMSMVLCVAMLAGTTFAWFTDSVTSGNNIIASGNLDVTMEWLDGTAAPTDSAAWIDASTGAIFDYDNWEPGYAVARHIKIANEGSLALKYRIHIAANGEVSKLADVIDVYYLDPAQQLNDRTALTEENKLGTLSALLANLESDASTATGALAKGEKHTVTLVLKMQESAGNEYQNLAIGSTFSIILIATQDNVESDSFDENYDDIEVPDMHVEKIDGVTYGMGADGNYYMISVDDGTLTTFTVDDKVTVLGTGNGVYDNDRVFGKNAPLTSLTLPEGLTEIKDNALNTLPNLTTVNIPSTVKTIGIQAFRITGMSEVTLPASVKTVKEGAFRDMANLTTVTVEGNVAFEKYAFRSCPNLTSIYLLGDDVTFADGQFASHTDAGSCAGTYHPTCGGLITVYVKNATVAARLLAAQPSANCYEVKILGASEDGSDATDVEEVANNTQLDAAIAAGAGTVVLGDGNYVVPNSAQGKTLTIVGNGNTAVATNTSGSYEGCNYALDGSNVVFENIVITTDGKDFTGYARCKATFNNCVINNTLFLYGDTEFNNCTFNDSGNSYNLWTYGATNATFNNCTFNCEGKAIYVDGNGNTGTKVIVNNCKFNDIGDNTVVDNKAAIETGTTYGKTYELIIDNTTVSGFAINPVGISTNSTLWANKNSMGTDKLNV